MFYKFLVLHYDYLQGFRLNGLCMCLQAGDYCTEPTHYATKDIHSE